MKKSLITILVIFLALNVAGENCTNTIELLSDCNLTVQFLKQDGMPETDGNCFGYLYKPDYSLAFSYNQLTHFEEGMYRIETDANFDTNGMWTFSTFCIGTDENGFNSMDFQVVNTEPNDQLNLIREDTAKIIATTSNIWNAVDGLAKTIWTYGQRTLTEPEPFPTPLTTEEVKEIVRDISEEQTIGLMGLVTTEISIFWTFGIPAAIAFGLAVSYLLSKIRKGIFKNEWIKSIILAIACLGSILGVIFTLSLVSSNLNLLTTIAPMALTIMAAIIATVNYFNIKIKGTPAWYYFTVGAVASGILALSVVFYWAVFWAAFFTMDIVIIAIIITKAEDIDYKGLKVWKMLLYTIPPLLATVLVSSQLIDTGIGAFMVLAGITIIYFLDTRVF